MTRSGRRAKPPASEAASADGPNASTHRPVHSGACGARRPTVEASPVGGPRVGRRVPDHGRPLGHRHHVRPGPHGDESGVRRSGADRPPRVGGRVVRRTVVERERPGVSGVDHHLPPGPDRGGHPAGEGRGGDRPPHAGRQVQGGAVVEAVAAVGGLPAPHHHLAAGPHRGRMGSRFDGRGGERRPRVGDRVVVRRLAGVGPHDDAVPGPHGDVGGGHRGERRRRSRRPGVGRRVVRGELRGQRRAVRAGAAEHEHRLARPEGPLVDPWAQLTGGDQAPRVRHRVVRRAVGVDGLVAGQLAATPRDRLAAGPHRDRVPPLAQRVRGDRLPGDIGQPAAGRRGRRRGRRRRSRRWSPGWPVPCSPAQWVRSAFRSQRPRRRPGPALPRRPPTGRAGDGDRPALGPHRPSPRHPAPVPHRRAGRGAAAPPT